MGTPDQLGFPLSISPKDVLTELDIALLAEASLQGAGSPQPIFGNQNWLPVNERLSDALERARIALRDLDDQRAVVLHIEIGLQGAKLNLGRAPHPATVRSVHQTRVKEGVVNRAVFGEPHVAVLLEWPL